MSSHPRVAHAVILFSLLAAALPPEMRSISTLSCYSIRICWRPVPSR